MSIFSKDFENKYTKKIALNIVNRILNDPSKMKDLMECFLGDDIRITQRAAWPLGMLGEHAPDLISPYNLTLLKIVKDDKSTDTVVRNILRTWKEIDFDEDLEGEIYDACYSLFINQKNAIAIRVFSMLSLIHI